MNDLLRHEITTTASPVVVKVGTRILTHADGRLNLDRIASLAEELHTQIVAGRKMILVSSGAVGAGLSELGLTKRPTDLARLQAVAAIGQTKLIEAYDRSFRKYGRHAAQILLTAQDLDDRISYLNVRNTIISLLEIDAVPIINENDTVAVDELMTTFGDNDRLAALVTNLVRAPLLVILSDIDGLYDGPPDLPASKRLETVTRIDEQVMSYVRDRLTGLSKGGMASKLNAARMATTSGENVVIANGHTPGVLTKILAGESLGTAFLAQGKSVSPWKRWIGFSVQPRGTLTLDEGACRAVSEQGRSLLAIGIVDSSGTFRKGDVVSLRDVTGREWARGLTNYGSDDLARIRGLRSDQIVATLGHCPYTEVIHRNNLALTQ